MTFSVLIADDHSLYRSGLEFLVRDAFSVSEVHQTGSFDGALDLLAQQPEIRLALIDLSMPGMAGSASLAEMRECYPSTTVAIVSASERREDVFSALQAGVHGYIPKSLSDTDMIAALEMILGGQVFVPNFVTTVGMSSVTPPPVQANATVENQQVDLSRFTARQKDVLNALVSGQSNKEIARTLGIAEGTVKIHLAAILQHLGAKNRTQAVALASKIL